MADLPKPGQKWVSEDGEVVTIDRVGFKGVSFTYDKKPQKGTSLMVLVGFLRYFRKM